MQRRAPEAPVRFVLLVAESPPMDTPARFETPGSVDRPFDADALG
jgi:hypothetical protein